MADAGHTEDSGGPGFCPRKGQPSSPGGKRQGELRAAEFSSVLGSRDRPRGLLSQSSAIPGPRPSRLQWGGAEHRSGREPRPPRDIPLEPSAPESGRERNPCRKLQPSSGSYNDAPPSESSYCSRRRRVQLLLQAHCRTQSSGAQLLGGGEIGRSIPRNWGLGGNWGGSRASHESRTSFRRLLHRLPCWLGLTDGLHRCQPRLFCSNCEHRGYFPSVPLLLRKHSCLAENTAAHGSPPPRWWAPSLPPSRGPRLSC